MYCFAGEEGGGVEGHLPENESNGKILISGAEFSAVLTHSSLTVKLFVQFEDVRTQLLKRSVIK